MAWKRIAGHTNIMSSFFTIISFDVAILVTSKILLIKTQHISSAILLWHYFFEVRGKRDSAHLRKHSIIEYPHPDLARDQ